MLTLLVEISSTDIVSETQRFGRSDLTFCSVTENGFAVKNESALSKEVAVKDTDRVNYYAGVTANLQAAIHEDGVDVRAYLAWSKSGLA